MRKLVLVLLISMVLTSCGDDTTGNPDKALKEIKACITKGGTPIYTTYREGEIRDFLGCTMSNK